MVTASEIIKRRQEKNGAKTPFPQPIESTLPRVSYTLFERPKKQMAYDIACSPNHRTVDTTSTTLQDIEELPPICINLRSMSHHNGLCVT